MPADLDLYFLFHAQTRTNSKLFFTYMNFFNVTIRKHDLIVVKVQFGIL